MSSLIAHDIETAPAPALMSLIGEHFPFDPEGVKMGNLKDPEKRAEKLKAAKDGHAFKIKAKAQLNPLLSYVCSIGIMEEGQEPVLKTVTDHAMEPDLLRWWWEQVDERWTGPSIRWVGWNSEAFDLSYIIKRSWLNGVPIVKAVRNGRYYHKAFVDLMREWCFYEYQTFAGLEATARALGVSDPDRPKGTEGKDFFKLLRSDPDRALAYARADLRETMAVGEVIL